MCICIRCVQHQWRLFGRKMTRMAKTMKKHVDHIPVFDLQGKSADQISRLWSNTAGIDTWITSNHDSTISIVNAWGQDVQLISVVQSVHADEDGADRIGYKSADTEARAVFEIEYYNDFAIVFGYTGSNTRDEKLAEVSRFAYDDPNLFDGVGLAVNHALLCLYVRHLFTKIRTSVARKGDVDIVYAVGSYDIIGMAAAKLEQILVDLKDIVRAVGTRSSLSDFDGFDNDEDRPV